MILFFFVCVCVCVYVLQGRLTLSPPPGHNSVHYSVHVHNGIGKPGFFSLLLS